MASVLLAELAAIMRVSRPNAALLGKPVGIVDIHASIGQLRATASRTSARTLANTALRPTTAAVSRQNAKTIDAVQGTRAAPSRRIGSTILRFVAGIQLSKAIILQREPRGLRVTNQFHKSSDLRRKAQFPGCHHFDAPSEHQLKATAAEPVYPADFVTSQ